MNPYNPCDECNVDEEKSRCDKIIEENNAVMMALVSHAFQTIDSLIAWNKREVVKLQKAVLKPLDTMLQVHDQIINDLLSHVFTSLASLVTETQVQTNLLQQVFLGQSPPTKLPPIEVIVNVPGSSPTVTTSTGNITIGQSVPVVGGAAPTIPGQGTNGGTSIQGGNTYTGSGIATGGIPPPFTTQIGGTPIVVGGTGIGGTGTANQGSTESGTTTITEGGSSSGGGGSIEEIINNYGSTTNINSSPVGQQPVGGGGGGGGGGSISVSSANASPEININVPVQFPGGGDDDADLEASYEDAIDPIADPTTWRFAPDDDGWKAASAKFLGPAWELFLKVKSVKEYQQVADKYFERKRV